MQVYKIKIVITSSIYLISHTKYSIYIQTKALSRNKKIVIKYAII